MHQLLFLKMKLPKFIFLLMASLSLHAQVGINTTSPSNASVLDVNSEINSTTFGGFMPPKVTLAERAMITPGTAEDGMLIFLQDGTTRCIQLWNAVDSTWDNVYCMPTGPSGPVLLGIQDFEITPATPTLGFTETNAGSFETGNGNNPNSPVFLDARSYGANNDVVELDFASVDASSYTDASLELRLASFSLNTPGNGNDGPDTVVISISVDGGSTFSSELEITGNSNSRYDFDATGSQTIAYDGNNVVVSVSNPAGTSTAGISTLEITGIPNAAAIVVKIEMQNDSSNELWVIDNVAIYGN